MMPVAKEENNRSTPLERTQDLAAQYAMGVNNAVKGLTDLLGAANPLSQVLEDNVQWYRRLLSATALRNEEEVSRIMGEAEDRGVLDQLSAAARAFGTAPADMVAGGLGSLSTFAVGGAAGKAAGLAARGVAAVQTGLGSGMQVGIVKNEIYLGVRHEMVNLGKSSEEAERIAREAQSYSGKNLDQLLLAAGLGAADGLTGAQRVIGRALMRGGLDHGASRVASVLGNGLSEASLEAAQGGQERLSTNVGMSREGSQVNPMRGVVGAAGLEGMVGAAIGGGIAAVESRSPGSASIAAPETATAAAPDASFSTDQTPPLKTTPPPPPPPRTTPEAPSAPGLETQPAPVTPRQTTPDPEGGKASDPQRLGEEKARLLGVENDPVGTYVAANYPELSKKAKSPAEFAANVAAWRSKIEGEIDSGKYLNKKVGTGEFVQQYGYEPSPSEYASLLEGHRLRQAEIQQGWVSYLRTGGYSDQVSALILNTITKETAYRSNGVWRFQKLGVSSNRQPPAADPELAARFSQEFQGDRKPSQALAEIKSEIAARTVLDGAGKKNMLLSRGEISWIHFPSKESDPAGFEENVKSLTDLSMTVEEFGCTKWCCAHGMARSFLEGGDFYAGVDTAGRARLGIRMEGSTLREIRGVLHSQAVEPGLAPQLKKFVEDQSLSGESRWVDDATIKGKVASLASGGTWEDLKKAIGREDDNDAADFVHSYRGPSGAYDFLVGADNDHVQRVVWEKLSSRQVSPLNMIARAGSFSQARGWVDGSVLDTPRAPEHGGGAALHALFADNEGQAAKAPPLLKEWGLLTPARQRATDADLNNIWHIQAGGRGNALARSSGSTEKSDLLQFLDWDGIDGESLLAPNKDRLTPMHLFLVKQASPTTPRGSHDDLDSVRPKVVEAFLRHADGETLLHDAAGKWKCPMIFSAAEGGMLSEVITAGLATPSAISAVTDADGNTPWHKADFGDMRRLLAKKQMSPSFLALTNKEGVSVAETICRRPGGFFMLLENGVLTAPGAEAAKGTRPSLAHSAASAGDAEKALESGLFSRSELLRPSWGSRSNFLHLWGSQGLRAPDAAKLRQLTDAAGIVPSDFEQVNDAGENAYLSFAEKPGGLQLLAKAGLVTSAGLGTPGGVWRDTPLHKLPSHSQETYHLLASQGLLTREQMLTENSHGQIPLHQYLQDEFNAGEGIDGVKRLASVLGLRSEDFTARHGVDGRDAFDVIRQQRRKMEGKADDPLAEFVEAGLIDHDEIFQQRHGRGEPPGLESRTETQKKMALSAWGRSPFEDAMVRGGPVAFERLCLTGAVTSERMSRRHGEKSEWTNHAEFLLRTAADEPGWMPSVLAAVEGGLVNQAGLAAEARSKPGPVYMRFNEFPSVDPMVRSLEKGYLSPKDLLVEPEAGRGSLLSSVVQRSDGNPLSRLIEGGHLEPGALSRVSIPYAADSGNPALYLLEKKPELFDLAARRGLFDKREAVFGRDGFGGPIAHALRKDALSSLSKPGLITPELLEDAAGMRRAWVASFEEVKALDLAQALVKGGASVAQVRASLTNVEGDGNSTLSSVRSKGAAESLSSLAAGGFVSREDLSGPKSPSDPFLRESLRSTVGRDLIKSVLSSDPGGLSKLVESGLVAPGDIYGGVLGKSDMVRFAIGMTRNADEEIELLRALASSGAMVPGDASNLARDLCARPQGSAALREAIRLGVVGKEDLAAPGEEGKSALDILVGRASVTAARRGDLAHLLEEGLVPQGYEGQVRRGAQGRFSAISDAVDRVSSRLQGLLSSDPDPSQSIAPLASGSLTRSTRPLGARHASMAK